MSIAENLQKVQQKIQNACIVSGRDPDIVKLIVVTKNQPAWKINELLQAGIFRFGENYPEQLPSKFEDIEPILIPEWHMIGHLQSRKIKYVVEYFSMVHSIDHLDTAIKLNDACKIAGIILPVCIEVNLAGEASKSGMAATDVANWKLIVESIARIAELKCLHPVGLMTMPPFVLDGKENRIHFRNCRKLLETVNQELRIADFTELSMGTSIDYETAIEEGATFVRIGEAILGSRNT